MDVILQNPKFWTILKFAFRLFNKPKSLQYDYIVKLLIIKISYWGNLFFMKYLASWKSKKISLFGFPMNHFFRTLIMSNDLYSIQNTEIYYWNGLRWNFTPKLGTILPSNWLEGKYISINLKWKRLGKHFSLWDGNCVYISSLMVGPTTSNSFLALNGLEALPR